MTQKYQWSFHFNEVNNMGEYSPAEFNNSLLAAREILVGTRDDFLDSFKSVLSIAHSQGSAGLVIATKSCPRGMRVDELPEALTEERLARGRGDPVFVSLADIMKSAVEQGLYAPVKRIKVVNPPAVFDGKIVPSLAVLLDPDKNSRIPEDEKLILKSLGYP